MSKVNKVWASSDRYRLNSYSIQKMILRDILFYKKMSRAEICQRTGISLASVTNYTRELIGAGFLLSQNLKVSHAKKPIQELIINPDAGISFVVHASAEKLKGVLVRFNGDPVNVFERKLKSSTQVCLMTNLAEITKQAQDYLVSEGRFFTVMGIGLPAEISERAGIVFKVKGINDWEPCQPQALIQSLRGLKVKYYTEAGSKVCGLSVKLKIDDRVGYFEYDGNTIHLATFQKGQLDFGHYGTSGAYVHQKISDKGELCYCGQRGCLVTLLKRKKITKLLLIEGLLKVVGSLGIEHIGLEWSGILKWLDKFEGKGINAFYEVDDAEMLAIDGLRFLVAEENFNYAILQKAKQ